jgi:hypothetical protein
LLRWLLRFLGRWLRRGARRAERVAALALLVLRVLADMFCGAAFFLDQGHIFTSCQGNKPSNV